MKHKIELNVAWIIWNLLAVLNNGIRRRYEKEFLEAVMSGANDLYFFKKRSDELIPF